MKNASWLFGNIPSSSAGEESADFAVNWWRGARAIGGILRVSPSVTTFYPNRVESWLGGTGFRENTGSLHLEEAGRPGSKIVVRSDEGKTYLLRMSDPERLRAVLDRRR